MKVGNHVWVSGTTAFVIEAGAEKAENREKDPSHTTSQLLRFAQDDKREDTMLVKIEVEAYIVT